jgi:hypothetical protein
MLSRKMLLRSLAPALALALAMGCNGDNSTDPGQSFLGGTAVNPEIGLVINSTGRALTMFQLGNPSEQRQIPFGASSAVTLTGLSLHGTRALVPLGDAASIALVDLEDTRIERFFTFPAGNATGSAWLDDNTFLAANFLDDYVAKGTLDQTAGALTTTVAVAPAPTAIVMAGGRAFVVSSNLDESYAPIDNGVVTVVDPATMTVVDDIEMGGMNSLAAALGPDGKLYVLNVGPYGTDGYVDDASVTIINTTTLTTETTIPGFPKGAGSIRIEDDGLAYISSYTTGTVVWNTTTRTFVRDADHPVCAGNPCRGAFDADRAGNGALYQAFFGDVSHAVAPYIFVFAPDTYELVDSIPVGVGPTSVEIARFR